MASAWRGKIGLPAIFVGAFFCGSGLAAQAQADEAWLRYAEVHGPDLPIALMQVRALGNGVLEQSAVDELKHGIPEIAGAWRPTGGMVQVIEVVAGTAQEVSKAYPDLAVPHEIAPEGFWLGVKTGQGYLTGKKAEQKYLNFVIVGGDERGVLYGAFDFLRQLAQGQEFLHRNVNESPAMAIRWVDEWDGPTGFVERGYAGKSIFFEDGKVREDLSDVSAYARLLASVGINGCDVNSVNGAAPFLTSEWLKQLTRIADAMRPWGVRMAMSVDIASPQKIGGLKTFDPLDPQVKAWWASKVDEIYTLVPDFAGFTVKADSEGQPGPASYGRSPADAANVLADALAPHGGVVLYRAFVYNNHLDYGDMKADRARAAYDIFHPLDGKFDANVIVQTKEGPIDFQAQEPVSPLFAGLRETSQAMELQITQEYLGQQRHLVYLAPMWKWVLDFDLRVDGGATLVKKIIPGTVFHRPLGGMVGVADVGRDGWLGAPLAMANLYAFGRLAWNPELTAEGIAEEWTRQTISNDPLVVATVDKMLMQSWPTYVDYTGPLGTQTLTDITGTHYGPNIEASERNGWGQWHRDDAEGIGMNRTVATGTGFIGQYPPEVAKMYESVDTCPDYLLLFFHHVPYTHKLHTGKTVIQYFYDSHYEGAEEAARLGEEWATLKGKIDPKLYEDERARLDYQAGHAMVWRDAIVQYFLKESGIQDAQGRAGHYPGRLEAEDARLSGYTVMDVRPWEDASGGKAVTCAEKSCAAEWTYAGAAGRFDVAAQYFDLQGGVAHFTLDVNGSAVAQWAADAALLSRRPNGDNSTRTTARGPDGRGIDLKPGDVLRVEGAPDGSDPAALDYVEIEPIAGGRGAQ
jgi:alpha-glucuronidase